MTSFASSPSMYHCTSKKWDDIFNDQVPKDDPLWTQYLVEAALFDTRAVDQWNKIVDVVLVYVALFTAVLTAFIIDNGTQLQPSNSVANVSNQILVAIYQQLAAQSTNTSIPVVDPTSFFNQETPGYNPWHRNNILLYTSLTLSVIVSMMALAAKLWLIAYSKRVFSAGSPYERALRRQEAYDGVRAWKLGSIIEGLPLLLLGSVYMFSIFIEFSLGTDPDQMGLGYFVGAVLIVGNVWIFGASCVAAFIPACPFHSFISTLVQLFFKCIPDYRLSKRVVGGKLSQMKPGLFRVAVITLLAVAFIFVTALLDIGSNLVSYALYVIPTVAAFVIGVEYQREDCRRQKYGLPLLSVLVALTLPTVVASAGSFNTFALGIGLVCGATILIVVFGVMVARLSKPPEDKRKIDAIAWFLRSTSSQDPSVFRKAGQLVSNDIGRHYRPDLLNFLMPLLSPIIISHSASELHENPGTQTENLGIFVACLARLSEFPNEEGSFWTNEDSKLHLTLQEPLYEKLVELAAEHPYTSCLSKAARNVLNNFEMKNRYHV